MKYRVPMIWQAEMSECGLACLAMIAGAHGHKIDMAHLRRQYKASLRGMTAQHILEAAQRLQFASRALRVEPSDFQDITLPCILHWKMNHFVVLSKVRGPEIVIHDPAYGIRRINVKELDQCFTGIVLEFWPAEGFTVVDRSTPVTLRELLGSASKFRRSASVALTFALLLEATTLCSPIIFQRLIDRAVSQHVAGLISSVIFLLLFGSLETMASAATARATADLGRGLNLAWQTRLLRHLVSLPLDYFETHSTGDILSRFDASEVVRRTVTSTLVTVSVSGLVTSVTILAMLIYSIRLTPVVIIGTLLYLGLRHAMLDKLREASLKQLNHESDLRTHLLETLYGIRPLRIFRKEAQRVAGWLNILVETNNSRVAVEELQIANSAASTAVLRIETAIILGMGVYFTLHNSLTLGGLFAFLAYKDKFKSKTVAMIDGIYDIRALTVHLDRVADIVRTTPEGTHHIPAPPAIVKEELRGLIEMRSVWFRYSEVDPWILQDVNLVVQPGECIAVTGASGAGKSTLVKLLSGLLRPVEGVILIDGQPLGRIEDNHAPSLAVVLQDDMVFSGTIAENIHFFSDAPDMAAVIHCAQMACLHKNIISMPMGYDTALGSAGVGISGGQRQRLLIARALYMNPKTLIFDESTSHLDVPTERAIAQSLRNLSITRIIVAHRADTIAIADRIFSFDAGRVVEQGTKFRDIVPKTELHFEFGLQQGEPYDRPQQGFRACES